MRSVRRNICKHSANPSSSPSAAGRLDDRRRIYDFQGLDRITGFLMPISGMIMPNMGMSVKSGGKRSRHRRGRQPTIKPSSSTGLAGALFSTTQQRMLGLLFGQPDRRFFANELIALTGSGSGAVQRELQRLTGSGLVTSTKEGSRRYFQANSAA